MFRRENKILEIFKLFIQKSAILYFRNKFSTELDLPIMMIHSSSPDLYTVPGAGLHSHHTAPCGEHCVTVAVVGGVVCLRQQVSIDEEGSTVRLPRSHRGKQAVAQSPCSRHRHSEDP